MRLLDNPLDKFMIDETLRLLDGNICRICVSDKPEEIVSSLGFAIDRLSMLAYSRVKSLNLRKNPSEN